MRPFRVAGLALAAGGVRAPDWRGGGAGRVVMMMGKTEDVQPCRWTPGLILGSLVSLPFVPMDPIQKHLVRALMGYPIHSAGWGSAGQLRLGLVTGSVKKHLRTCGGD